MAERAIHASDVRVVLSSTEIVKGASLSLPGGEFRVIAGPNGAGKSTFLRALLGLICSSGEILVGGKPIEDLSHAERAKELSYVPQNSVLAAALSVEELVAQARFIRSESKTRTRDAVDRAFARTGMQRFAHRSYLELSGGERRLALIARALCTEAPTLILDEPTACLDIANRLRVLELLKSLASEGYAVLAVLHDLDDVSTYADHVTIMQNGIVAHAGAPSEVITPEAIRKVYGVEVLENAALQFRLPETMA